MILPRLDVATLMFVGAIERLVIAPVFLLLWRREPAARWFLIWSIAQMLAFADLVARWLDAPAFAVLFSSSAIALLWAGVRCFEARRVRWWLVALMALLPVVFLAFPAAAAAWSIIVIQAAIFGLVGGELLRHRPISLARGLAAAGFGLLGLEALAWPWRGDTLLIGGAVAVGFLVFLALMWLAHERTEARLAHEALLDPQTGLLNRRGMERLVPQLLGMAQRSRSPVAVLMADLDHFKAINDRHGHGVGDLALQSFVATVRGVLKRQGDFATRYGGEEFVILLPDTDPAGARAMAEKLRQAVAAQPLLIEGISWNLTVSIGVSLVPHSEQTIDAALARADRALYLAKSGGRNRVAELLPGEA